MQIVDLHAHLTLDDYAAHANLTAAVAALRAQAEPVAQQLRGRTIWMVNSTAQGGGVAELLRSQVPMLRDLGFDVRWIVLESSDARFFALTKRLHNLIHAADESPPADSDRELFEQPSHDLARQLEACSQANDIIVVHDPQPLPLAGYLKQQRSVRMIWRCHIGVDAETSGSRAAWSFLRSYADHYDDVVFSLPEYVPEFLRSRARIIHPTIDPLSHKNRELSLHKLLGILADADLVAATSPLIAPRFAQRARRLQPDGRLTPATLPEDFGLAFRPIITQVSRWDRLKGFAPLLEAFALMKIRRDSYQLRDERHAHRLEHVRLVLAGPDPGGIQDDPEAREVFAELTTRYAALPSQLQRDVALIVLPMHSRKENALMVNALQRASDIVVQNSIREGFGLTVSEAMWKRIAMLGSAAACGVRMQVRDDQEGRLATDPEDAETVARIMVEMLADQRCLERWGRNAQRRVHEQFLVFSELQQWLGLLQSLTSSPTARNRAQDVAR